MARYNEAIGVDSVENFDKNDYGDFKAELAANGSLTSKFDREFFDAVYPGSGYKEYVESTNKDLATIITDAKAGNEYAECYLLIAARKMAYFVFWKVFIGSAASAKVIRQRLDNGDFGEFIGIMYIAFDKAIKSFRIDKYKTLKLGNWQYWFGQYLRMDCISENVHRSRDPDEAAIRPDGMEDSEKGGATAWDKVTGEENAYHLDTDEFTASWQEFCDDPELDKPCNKKVDVPLRYIIADVLEGKKTLPEIAADYGVSKNTLYSAVNVGHLLSSHDVDQNELAKQLHTDPDKVLKMLRK